MTEANIDHLISVALMLGSLYIVYYFFIKGFSENNSPSVATQNNITPIQKSIWDKLKIISIAVSSIAALIYSIVKVVEIFIDKK